MTVLAAAEHFAGPPGWTWYILFYFFFAGLADGTGPTTGGVACVLPVY